MDDSMLFELLVLTVLIFVNAFFASSEIALISLNDQKIRRMAESGHRKAKIIVGLIEEPSKFLATIQVGVTLSGFLASAFAAESFAKRLTTWAIEANIGISESVIHTLSLVAITLLLSYITLVFGELVPKRIGMQKPEAISMLVARPLSVIATITKPFVRFLSFSTNTVIRLLGQDPHAEEETITEEEIRMMVDVGEEKGVIQQAEKAMISNVLEFNDKTVEEVMIHRTNVVGVSTETPIQDILSIFVKEQYTRIVVYEKSMDNIVGILNIKDLLPQIVGCETVDIQVCDVMRKPHFLLEATKTSDAFTELQKQGVHLAVVVDEYGGTSGIVTLEDLVEEIVGNIRDEHDEEEVEQQQIQQVGDEKFMINGVTSITDLNEQLNLHIEDADYDTIGGFFMGQIGRVIKDNEKLSLIIEDYNFTVMEASENRIVRLLAKRLPQEEIL